MSFEPEWTAASDKSNFREITINNASSPYVLHNNVCVFLPVYLSTISFQNMKQMVQIRLGMVFSDCDWREAPHTWSKSRLERRFRAFGY
jgi:hypothetical protein